MKTRAPQDWRARKGPSLLICLAAYVIAAAAAIGTARLLGDQHPLLAIAAADLAGTASVFLFSLAFNNSSLYDPYWGVAPLVIVLFYFCRSFGTPSAKPGALLRGGLVVFLIGAWGARLTLNWIRRWRGLGDEDWRYRSFRESGGSWYWPVSFLGIHLLPTGIVYMGCLSLYPLFNGPPLSLTSLDGAAFVITAGAILIETLADAQLRRFASRPENRGKVLLKGLWRYSRHPNYFGEVLFWWGLFLFAAGTGPGAMWTVIGPTAMTILFVTISIPMMERRLEKTREGYRDATGRVSPLIPWVPPEQP